ncbi:MAG: DUF4845 domain-containing protein [Sulfurimicrobium sp.]|jgi:hypothetical protein|nr:DUF4845 domain-containing protein [Sulfurimicrobium sp.]MDP1704842.1 DUF4845 domain-containing protein [Sulfurimicrobium sp.]MDP1896602.1 DUF4845 domain-containing protein [Sulfurimicrobium sp.]MDP2197238.1 DUF4845 domain-containing protein [Sulfurimicrobium sp.]MDP2963543.1 DUF4845 domain-containing protein [Sulfurimicrobium sp.]
MKKNQQGMTFLGVTFVGMIVVFGAILVMKLIPPYLEFWSVQKIIGVMAKDSGLPEMTTAQVRASFDKRAVVDNVNVISGKDLEISKERGQLVVAANYSVTVPIVGNLSALIAFQATTQGTKAAKMVGE